MKMNRAIFPTIIMTVILVAAGFAFAPVDRVTAVHGELIDEIGEFICDEIGSTGYDDTFPDGTTDPCK